MTVSKQNAFHQFELNFKRVDRGEGAIKINEKVNPLEIFYPTKYRGIRVNKLGMIKLITAKTTKGFWQGPKNNEYLSVSIWTNKKRKNKKVHQIVLETFREPRPQGMVGDHIDRDKSNNSLKNLRWVTQSRNTKNVSKEVKKARTLQIKKAGKMYGKIYGKINGKISGFKRRKIPWETIVAIREDHANGMKLVEIGRKYGIKKSNIGQITRKEIYKYESIV